MQPMAGREVSATPGELRRKVLEDGTAPLSHYRTVYGVAVRNDVLEAKEQYTQRLEARVAELEEMLRDAAPVT